MKNLSFRDLDPCGSSTNFPCVMRDRQVKVGEGNLLTRQYGIGRAARATKLSLILPPKSMSAEKMRNLDPMEQVNCGSEFSQCYSPDSFGDVQVPADEVQASGMGSVAPMTPFMYGNRPAAHAPVGEGEDDENELLLQLPTVSRLQGLENLEDQPSIQEEEEARQQEDAASSDRMAGSYAVSPSSRIFLERPVEHREAEGAGKLAGVNLDSGWMPYKPADVWGHDARRGRSSEVGLVSAAHELPEKEWTSIDRLEHSDLSRAVGSLTSMFPSQEGDQAKNPQPAQSAGAENKSSRSVLRGELPRSVVSENPLAAAVGGREVKKDLEEAQMWQDEAAREEKMLQGRLRGELSA
eukprot:761404-Hanusia_phi.AAC.4